MHIVATKNRIAKVDGRHVHWVRTYSGGDRYSLVSLLTPQPLPRALVRVCVCARARPRAPAPELPYRAFLPACLSARYFTIQIRAVKLPSKRLWTRTGGPEDTRTKRKSLAWRASE